MPNSLPLAALLQSAIADELRHISDVLERLAEVLVADEHFASKFLDQLQAFDLLVQCTHESAAVLDRLSAGDGAYDAVAPVRLGHIQERLRAALAQAA